MDEDKMVDIPHEGTREAMERNADTENDNSAASPAEENETEEPQSDEGDEKAHSEEDKLPFHKHPRWIEREKEWEEKLESKLKEQAETFEEKLKQVQTTKNQDTEIPDWFRGGQDETPEVRKLWNNYLSREKSMRDEMKKEMQEEFLKKQTAEKKREDEATQYMHEQIELLEKDKELNPSGKKIDKNKLLTIVLENELIDGRGRWNYKAGMKIYNSSQPPVKPNETKKKIAGATTSEAKGEGKEKNYKTADDFKTDRPW